MGWEGGGGGGVAGRGMGGGRARSQTGGGVLGGRGDGEGGEVRLHRGGVRRVGRWGAEEAPMVSGGRWTVASEGRFLSLPLGWHRRPRVEAARVRLEHGVVLRPAGAVRVLGYLAGGVTDCAADGSRAGHVCCGWRAESMEGFGQSFRTPPASAREGEGPRDGQRSETQGPTPPATCASRAGARPGGPTEGWAPLAR